MTTAKKGYYGTDGASADSKYRKKMIPGSDEAYFMQVNKSTGEMEVWNEEWGQDRKVATLDKDGNLVFDRTFTKGARDFEEKFFATDEGKKAIRDFAEEVVILDKTTGRDNDDPNKKPIPAVVAKTQTEELLETGKETTPDDADPLELSKDAIQDGQAELAEIKNNMTPRSGSRTKAGSFGSLTYPLTRNSKQDFVKFTLLEYKPKTVGGGADGSGFGFGDRARVGPSGETAGRVILGDVSLPIPGGIKDQSAADWQGKEMNEIQIQTSALARSLTGAGDDPGAVAGEIVNRIGTGSDEVKKAIQESLAGNATGTGNQLLTRSTGMIMNPNLELLFQKPTLRPFTFTFDFSPRSKKEALQVVQIIRFFKQGMSPIREASNLFLLSPHTFQVHYILGGDSNREHPYIGKMKECAMTNLDVDYTPQQNYSTLKDGFMTSYRVTMQLKELEPVFNDDYADDSFSSFREDPAEQAALNNTLPARIGF
jgi:hypothetical protein|tara:strand:+ start:2667 stop:4115 length:1449 start_codon:yes stop_codon:yes gene_type:complete